MAMLSDCKNYQSHDLALAFDKLAGPTVVIIRGYTTMLFVRPT